jgi:hypothetical protein
MVAYGLENCVYLVLRLAFEIQAPSSSNTIGITGYLPMPYFLSSMLLFFVTSQVIRWHYK